MYMAYCPNCKKETGYKRSIGFGTLFAVILTGGLWLVAILFYPTRCAVCGGSKSTRKPHPEANKPDETKLVNIEEYQNWAEEFIYQFDRDVTKVSSNPGTPVKDYDILLSFFDTIKEKSLDTPSIRGLENKKVFEQTFSKAQNLFDELAKTPEVQNHLCQQETARVEREQLEQQKADIAAEASAKFKRSVVTVGAFLILGLVLVLTYMDYRSSMAEAEKRQWLQAHNAEARKNAEEAKRAEAEKRQQANTAVEAKIDIQRATDADALYRFGNMHYEGKDLPLDYSEALKLYQKAADMGHTKAQYSIGWMYFFGYGVTKDKTLAMKWFKKAADQGDESAKAALLKFQ